MANKANAAEEREQKQFRTILEDLLKLPENKICADCGSAAPRWASSKLGIFICMKCSGIHRSLGTHISFVRSVTLDKWKQSEVEFMQRFGNTRANEIWEGGMPRDFPRPHPGDQHALERFIRQKYEQKRFFREPTEGSHAQQPAPVTIAAPPVARMSPAPAPVAARPAPVPATMDLLGSGWSTTTPAPTTPTPAPVVAPTPAPAPIKNDGFGAFVSAPSQSSSSSGSSLAAALNPSAESQKANIMNLFNTPASVPAPVPGFGAPATGYPGYPYPYQGQPGAPPGYSPPPSYPQGYPQAGYPPPGYGYPPGAY